MARARPTRRRTSSKAPSPATRAGAAGRREPPACRSGRAVAIFLVVAAASAALDLGSKEAVFSAVADRPAQRVTVIPRVLRLTLSTNPGIVFGLPVPGWIVKAATLAAMAAVVVLFACSPRRFWGLHTALAMVLGGAAGNLYDRVFARVRLGGEAAATGGRVRDFIDVYAIDYPVFNVADILLVVGLGLVLLHMIRHRPRGQA